MKTFLWIIAFLNALLIGAAIRENRKPNADFEGSSGYMRHLRLRRLCAVGCHRVGGLFHRKTVLNEV
jgi:hypothetical protein